MRDKRSDKDKIKWTSGKRKASYLDLLEVELKVIQGNFLLPNIDVTFSLNDSNVQFYGKNPLDREVTLSTSAVGRVKVKLEAVGKKVGKFELYAYLTKAVHVQAPPLGLEFQLPVEASLSVQVTTDSQMADGVQEDNITATVLDQNCVVLPGIEVNFSNHADEVNIITPSVITNSNGEASTGITSKTPGVFPVVTSTGGKSTSINVTFLPIAPPLKNGLFTMVSVNWNPQRGTETVVITARDENKNLLKNKPVDVSLISDSAIQMLRFDSNTDEDTGTFNVDLVGSIGSEACLNISVADYYGSVDVVLGKDPKN